MVCMVSEAKASKSPLTGKISAVMSSFVQTSEQRIQLKYLNISWRLMAEALLPFAVERLWNLLVRETKQFQGVEEQFEGLKNDVDTLRCFLKDAEAKKHSSEMVRKVIKDIKEIVLDAEDIVETFLLKKELGESSSSSVKRFAYVTVKSMEDSSQVVSITGMGGIGKTTLARKVFNHETIKTNFPGLAWVCVSQQFERKCVWQTILRQLIRPECDVSKMMEDELLEKIVRVFETQKALIVIDDIWSEGDWNLIKHVFLPKKGWKVLLTSRNEEVALHADKQCVTFKPECLTFEEGWDLFQKLAFPIKETAGLPLAIKVLGGMLRKNYTLRQWKTIRENIKAPIVRGTGFDDGNINTEVYDVLNLSFEELPAYLKHCFLYLASFPEDYEINTKKLSYYWAAEGIQRPMDFNGAAFKRDVDTSRFETLRLHDKMRELCLLKAEEENFVQTIDTSTAKSKFPCKSRRLAVVRCPGEAFSFDTEVKNPSLRTLLFIECRRWKATSLLFTRHKLMRVLDLSYVDFKGGKVPSSIGKLIHLRYLSLVWTNVTQLPASMRNLKKLLYLNLDVICFSTVLDMPNILKEMRELTFLCLPMSLDDKTKLELGNLVKLETLECFSTKYGRDGSEGKLSHLEGLTIYNDKKFYTPTNDDEEGFVWDFVNLKELKLEIYMPRLPDAQRFPSHLTTISLKQSRLKKDPMPILEKLLHLKDISLQSRSFCGGRMDCSRDGFSQLQKLKFEGLEEWEE
ncbi:unnamed protein product [Brassica oleracea var. botrytis]|uniref:NB-ARC domain-containing protein n=1 Tax=Brassica oleracea var. oleracea TaxID=109376 RepID=A0A0D3AXW0_BRAOL